MDSFESLSTITFIQVDYDPAVIPSSWTVFSAGETLLIHTCLLYPACDFVTQERSMRGMLMFPF
jgi:hypothetical protein